ncbi:hypothetical protein NDU88_006897 [Pleurodeles waltl]|uniref:Uncharacterized protein n=1 Tax=Pleurodeles waltl TaxID=8319 RepID=A0AAV7SQZ4_PLEWA|nr:hypothetical protein NDU88_006897 [Pleurodeles waltl]
MRSANVLLPLRSISDKVDTVLAAVKKIGAALENMRATLECKIDAVLTDLTLLHEDHRKLAEKVHNAELTIEELQLQTWEMDSSLK